MLAAYAENSTRSHRNCEFCDEFAGGVNNGFYARYQGCPKTRFVLSTKSFHIFPSIGQLVDGYLLAAPKEHYSTFDRMPGALWAEYQTLYGQVRHTLSNIYGTCITYEHGTRGPSAGGCGIYHAHMHFVPFPWPIDDLLGDLKKRFPWKTLPNLVDLRTRGDKVSSYLFCEAPDSMRYLFDVSELPSQFMRRLLSKSLRRGNWDWRVAGREEQLLAALQRLPELLDGTQRPARDPKR